MLELKGKIEFDPVNVTKKHNKQSSWKRVAMVRFNDDIVRDGDGLSKITSDYYAWFIERRFNIKLNKPLRGTHITIINDVVDNDIYEQARAIFHNKEITLFYDPTNIRSNGSHWWIKVESNDSINIRTAMGLSPYPYFGLHLTIGLATHLQEVHSKYILRQCKMFNI